MAQAKDLNISPYYDDFDPSNDFYKVLFKPGFPVQARELTNLQSILQNQIESFGSHVFKEGSIVIPGAPTYDVEYNAVQLNPTQFGIDISLYTDQLVGKVLEGQTSGVTASVDFVALPDDDTVENITIYVKYYNSGTTDPSLTKFIDGETLLTKENIVYGNTTINADTGVVTLLSNDAQSIGSAAFVGEGVYFIRGTFVNVAKQTIILDHYTNTPSYRVGLTINEQIITSKDDASLYDNAQGFTNYSAPGADRFKITLTLSKKLLTDKNDQNFFEILRIRNGKVQKIKVKNEYNIIGDELARRTYDESGNYSLNPFSISVENSLNNRLGNNGIFFSNQNTYEGNTPSDDLMCVKVSGGKAYVKGYEIQTDSLSILDVNKPRDIEKIDSTLVDFEMGKRLVVNNVYGQPDYRAEIKLYDIFNNDDISETSSASQIGVARIYSFNPMNTTYTGVSSKWNLYLWDVQLFTTLTWSKEVTSTDFPADAFIKGMKSGATGYTSEAASGSTSKLYQINGSFIRNEQVSVNGIPTNIIIKKITSHNSRDIKSVWQDSSFHRDFSANVSLSSVPLPNGISEIKLSGTTATAAGNPFSGVKVGDIIQYDGGQTVPTYNKVTAIDPDLFSLTLADSKTISGVCHGSRVDGVHNATLASGTIWSSSDNRGGLYEVLPNQNVSSVDFSNATLTVCGQIGGQTVTSGSCVVSINDFNDGGGVAISTAFFEPYSVSNYSVHLGTGSTTGVGTVSADSFSLLSGGSQAQFSGLPSGTIGNSLFNVTAEKQGIQSKIKNYEKSKILSITGSNLKESGSDANTSINDGLTYNGTGYGRRVQDDEISLNVPDAVKVISIYESIDGSQPTFDTLSFNATINVASNAIIGENIVGQESGAIARIVTNNGSTPSSGDANRLGIVYLNERALVLNEEVVFQESNITTTIDGINVSDGDGQYQDISRSFILDKGQRDQFYDYSRIVRKDNVTVPSKQLLIVYDHYTVPSSDTGDVFTVLSYNEDRYTEDIPFIGESKIRATDTLDFRPRVKSSGTLIDDITKSPFTFATRGEIFDTQPKFLLKNSGITQLGYEYYLGRIDKLYLTPQSGLTIVQGQSSVVPEPPEELNNSMELATLILPPYLYDPNDVNIRLTDNRRYTMRDVGLLEDRIENLEEVTTLSLLEASTEALTIEDANGRNRFKSGIFVDNFKTTKTINSNFSNIEIDSEKGEIKPLIAKNSLSSLLLPSKDTIDTEFIGNSNYKLLDPNVQKTGNMVTLKYDEVDWIEQSYATRVENVNPFHVISYNGIVVLSPSSDTWVRTIRLDPRIVNKGGNPEGRGGNDLRLVSEVSKDILVGEGKDQYMRARNTMFSATNLKPLTRYYQFLDGVSGVAYIPKLVEIASDSELTTEGSEGVFKIGETVKAYQTNLTTSQAAIQIHKYGEILPAGTFRVLPPDHKTGAWWVRFGSPAPEGDVQSTYNVNPYKPLESLPSVYTSSTPILNLDMFALQEEAQGDYSGFLWKGVRLVGQESGAIAYVKDHRLISDNYGDLIGSFWLQNPYGSPPPEIRIKTGKKVYRLSSSDTNVTPLKGSKLISSAESDYEATGTYEKMQVVTTRTWRERDYCDPLAQSFSVGGNIEAPDPNVGLDDDQQGVFLTAVDLFFANKDSGNNPVTVEIRTMRLGTPTRTVIGTPVTLKPSQITTSTDGETATKVTFPEPIFLEPGQEYAVVLLAPTSDQYEMWIARMGEDAVNLQSLPNVSAIKYTQQWALGSLFKSQNGSIWSPSQLEDLKMKLYKAKFTASSGTAFFTNPTLDVSNGYVTNLDSNPLITFPKTGTLGITTIHSSNTAGIGTFSIGRKIAATQSSNSNAIGYIVGTGCSVLTADVTDGGSGYQPGTTSGTTIETFNIVGRGSGYTFSQVVVGASGTVTGFTTESVGTGYTGGDVVGIKTTDMDGDVGTGALFTILDNGGIDTLYLSGIQGTPTSFGEGASNDVRFYAADGTITPVVDCPILKTLVVDQTPNVGNYIRVNQFDHGMYASNNKVSLSDINSNYPTSRLIADLTSDSNTISVASTTSPDFSKFEGYQVNNLSGGLGNIGYVRVENEIIGYTGIGQSTLTGITREIDSTLAIPHFTGAAVEKYELNGVSLRRINRTHDLSTHDIQLDSYYLDIKMDATGGKDRSSDIASGPPALSFENAGFFGGLNGHATRNIQFESLVPNYGIFTPDGTSNPEGSIRTVSGTSVDGSETSFLDLGYQPIQLNSLNKLNSPRIVCSKVNENEYLTNMERHKSFTTSIKIATDNEYVSPIIYTDTSFTEFRSNRLNNPITDYANNNLVNTPNSDPNSAIYVSDTINLSKPADSLKVIFSAYRNGSSDIRVLYNLIRPDDASQTESNIRFELFPGYDNLKDTTGDGFGNQVLDPTKNDGLSDAFVPASVDNEFLEYQYTADNLGEFIGYSIKIIMAGTNQAYAPRIKDFRTIALK